MREVATTDQELKTNLRQACRCGCGEWAARNRFYKRGHKPKTVAQRHTSLPTADAATDGNVTLVLTPEQVRRLWDSLTPTNKARAITAGILP